MSCQGTRLTKTPISFTRVPLVLPVPGKSQLRLEQEGVDLLTSIDLPVAPVVVIGPYRSGKSFLLNQLLGVSCGAWGAANSGVHYGCLW